LESLCVKLEVSAYRVVFSSCNFKYSGEICRHPNVFIGAPNLCVPRHIGYNTVCKFVHMRGCDAVCVGMRAVMNTLSPLMMVGLYL
jgi:hypothetical protein